jgi:hypothetical protein
MAKISNKEGGFRKKNSCDILGLGFQTEKLKTQGTISNI